MTDFTDVGKFHEKFALPVYAGPDSIPQQLWTDKDLVQFRIRFMQEELDEFIAASESDDIAGMADALVDLVYVALGTAHMFNLPWQALWDDVQAANMRKVRAAKDGSDSKRASAWDVVKPEGWTGPETTRILSENGFEL